MVAFLASDNLTAGLAIEPEQSIMMTSAAVGAAVDRAGPAPVAVTVTTASTTVPPAGRYWFWKTSAWNSVMDSPRAGTAGRRR